jgi:hypothetical protein
MVDSLKPLKPLKPVGWPKPVRWFCLLSTWIFILSCLYPIFKFPTYPLNLLALVGIYGCIRYPFKEHYLKNVYILFIHLAAFLWIPYDLSPEAFGFAAVVCITYLIFIYVIQDNVIDIYSRLFNEEHTTLSEFLTVRFGLTL